jgi:DNA-binding CsgD family transcriptional regulator
VNACRRNTAAPLLRRFNTARVSHIWTLCDKDEVCGTCPCVTTRRPRAYAFVTSNRQVLALLVEGLPNKLIARRLLITEKTVKSHLTQIFRELDVTDRTQAALWAAHHGATSGPNTAGTRDSQPQRVPRRGERAQHFVQAHHSSPFPSPARPRPPAHPMVRCLSDSREGSRQAAVRPEPSTGITCTHVC